MVIRVAVLGVVLAGTAMAQDAMPGMDMGKPAASGARAQQPKEAPRPNRGRQSADPMPPDMQGMQGMQMDGRDKKARAAGASEANSAAQQSGPADAKRGAGSDATSITIPFAELQEPEAIGLRTGADLPAPELLKDVVDAEPMGLPAFLSAAEAKNPTLAQAARNVDRSGEQARQASLPPNPTVGYSAEHIRGGSFNGGEQGAFFAQEFVLGRKLALRREVYRAEGRANDFALEVQRARVHNDVAHAFFDALAAQESVVVRDRLLKVAIDAQTNAHELERVGQADASDVLTAEVAAEQAKVEFVEAQRLFLANFAQLAAYAGDGAMPARPLTGELVAPPAIEPEEMVAKDVKESPAVAQARAEVGVAEARVRSAKREPVPNLTVKAGEWYSGETVGSTNLKAGWMSFAEAGVQLPLWNRNQGNVGAAEAELVRAQHEVTRTELWTKKETEPFAQQYGTARFRAERYRTEMLPRARRAFQLEAMKYQQMALAYPHVLAAQRMLFELQLGYVEALRQEWEAVIALEDAALMRGLEQPLSTGSDSTTINLPTGGSRD